MSVTIDIESDSVNYLFLNKSLKQEND